MGVEVSVILPFYNSEKYIAEAVSSILNQTYKNFELILINDGGQDSSLEICHSFKDERIKILNNPKNLGLIESLNRGISASIGKYICRMDADDVALPKRIETQKKFLDANIEIGLVGSNVEIIDGEGVVLTRRKDRISDFGEILFELSRRTVLLHPTVMGRRECFKEFKYDVSFKHAEDYDLWTRISSKYKITNLDDFLLRYRVHTSNISKIHNDEQLRITYLISQRYLKDTFKIEAPISIVKYYVHPRMYPIDISTAKNFWIFLKKLNKSFESNSRVSKYYGKSQITIIAIQFFVCECLYRKKIPLFSLFQFSQLLTTRGILQSLFMLKNAYVHKIKW